jgi:hypothetical protein
MDEGVELIVEICQRLGLEDFEVGLLEGYPPVYMIVSGEAEYPVVITDPLHAWDLVVEGIQRELQP